MTTFAVFKWKIFKCKRTFANSIFGYQKSIGITLIHRVQLGTSQLCEHKPKHNFQNFSVNLAVTANSFSRLSFSCDIYTEERPVLLNKIRNINFNILESTNSRMRKFPLCGSKIFIVSPGFNILNSIKEYILPTIRFNKSFFLEWFEFNIVFLFFLDRFGHYFFLTQHSQYLILNQAFNLLYLPDIYLKTIFLPGDLKFLHYLCLYLYYRKKISNALFLTR